MLPNQAGVGSAAFFLATGMNVVFSKARTYPEEKRMKIITAILFLALFSIGALAAGAKPHYIGMKRAKAIAHSQVKGTIKSSELEKEHGKMIYSFDIKTTAGITEVEIDAITGKVIATQVETPEDEAKEKAAEKNVKIVYKLNKSNLNLTCIRAATDLSHTLLKCFDDFMNGKFKIFITASCKKFTEHRENRIHIQID